MEEKEEKSPIFGTAIGDLGVVVIAALCTITLLMILFSPSPFEKLERAQARQEKEKARPAFQSVVSSGPTAYDTQIM